ncbi:MAG: hypothetical protein QF903_00190 [Planctomycetota bacterium]|jgi:purine-nucleoside phosphorylase|nr:hypothetical protein [Planctomycetota bacterium]MDP6762943.1 hypothetical protein [Planctomycetota bacterium]MDP6987877.1 hypothetical protein [Planctomycetota bacterium]
MGTDSFDDAIFAASRHLRSLGAADPDALLLMGTGIGLVGAGYEADFKLPLEDVEGVPNAWRHQILQVAESASGVTWLLEDAAGTPETGNAPTADEAPWTRGFPCWLAAASGAGACLHTSGGYSVGESPETAPGETLAVVSDHINLSGTTPLLGLGESRLGPLFPDQTRVHDAALREAALGHAASLGLPCVEAVVACTAGPAIGTPAERRFHASAGASVAVQGLAAPVIACAHAGLACLFVVAVIDPDGESPLEAQLAAADRLAPALEDLVVALRPDLARVARARREECS